MDDEVARKQRRKIDIAAGCFFAAISLVGIAKGANFWAIVIVAALAGIMLIPLEWFMRLRR